MGRVLHTPLGRIRKTGRKSPGFLSLCRIAASLCLFALGGFSLYSAFLGVGLVRTKAAAGELAASRPDNTPQPP
ncbi:divergent polysaccharide deacetylase family protein, partial [Rhizobium brockwellii]